MAMVLEEGVPPVSLPQAGQACALCLEKARYISGHLSAVLCAQKVGSCLPLGKVLSDWGEGVLSALLLGLQHTTCSAKASGKGESV